MPFLYESIQDFPVDVGQTDVTLRMVNVIGEQRGPFNGLREIQVFPGARWEIEISFLPSVRAEAQKLEAWLASLRGKAGTFWCADPYRSLPLGDAREFPGMTAEVLVTANAGEESLEVEFSAGWGVDWILKAGDFIEIEGRLHMVLADVETSGAGEGTVKVWPPLRETYAAETPVIIENARGVFALATNDIEFTRNVDGYNGAILRAVEVL